MFHQVGHTSIFLDMPYLDAFRFVFYLLLVLLVLTIGFAVVGHQYEGYDPTVRVP